MPFKKKELDDLEVLAILNGVIKAIDEIGELDFDFDKDYSEEDEKAEKDSTNDKLIDEAIEGMGELARMFGKFYITLLDYGFSVDQSFTLVKLYAESILNAAKK